MSWKNWIQVIKKQTNFSSKVVLVGLNFSVTKSIAIQIFKISWEITSIQIYQNLMASPYIINKLVLKSEYNIKRIVRILCASSIERNTQNLTEI